MKLLKGLAILLLAGNLYAGTVSFETVDTTSITAVGFTATNLYKTDTLSTRTRIYADSAVFVVEEANMRFRTDGTDPTGTVGTLVYIGDVVTIESSQDLANFSIINTTGTTGRIQSHYYE